MVEKLKDAANFLKAKITQDELQEALMQVTSEENWQASTHQLHEIANAAFNYEKWQRINEFIWDKLRKSKSWKKILKTLNLVEFLLKNGPPSIISGFKYDIYQFRSFDNYSHIADGVDRGQSIRERAKQIVELLSNEELLQQQRVKAKNIRQKMAGVVGSKGYGGYGGSSGWDSGNTKYESYNHKNYTGPTAGSDYGRDGMGVYGDYNYNKSTLDKYKDGKNITKPTGSVNQSYSGQIGSSNNIDNNTNKVQTKKPFQKIAPKLGKPGSKPPPKPQTPVTQKPAQKPQTNLNTGGGLMDEDILFVGTSTATNNNKSTQVHQQSNNNNIFDFNLLGDTSNHSNQSQKPVQLSNQNQKQTSDQNSQQMQQSHQPQQVFQQPNQMQFFQNQQPYNQIGHQQQFNLYAQQGNFSGTPYQPIQGQGFGQYGMAQYMHSPLQNTQNLMQGNINYNQQGGSFGMNIQTNQNMTNQYSNQQQKQTSMPNQINLSLNSVNKPTNQLKDDDDFGSFQSANSQKVKWMSSDQKNLTDLTGFGDQLRQGIGGNSRDTKQKSNIQIDMWSW